MVSDLLTTLRPRMQQALDHLDAELKTLRTGRANPTMLDGIMISAYGSMMPLKQAATVVTPEPMQLLVQPFDVSLLGEIRTAIVNADLGFNPSDDGRSLRIVIPALTAERRDELVKRAGKLAEECRIALRNIRGDGWDQVQKAQKAAEITEDDREHGREQLDKLVADFNAKVAEAVAAKEQEIRTV